MAVLLLKILAADGSCCLSYCANIVSLLEVSPTSYLSIPGPNLAHYPCLQSQIVAKHEIVKPKIMCGVKFMPKDTVKPSLRTFSDKPPNKRKFMFYISL